MQKSGTPVPRDQAAFYLIQGGSGTVSKRAEIVAVGGAQSALNILADDSLSRDWTNAATLLRKLCSDEDNREPIARQRASGRPATSVFISIVLSTTSSRSCQTAAAKCLALISAHADCCPLCLSAVQQINFWEPIALLLYDCKHQDADVKAHMYVAEALCLTTMIPRVKASPYANAAKGTDVVCRADFIRNMLAKVCTRSSFVISVCFCAATVFEMHHHPVMMCHTNVSIPVCIAVQMSS
jgi:hypothetical protein